jgi:dTDP-4-dehydrorhamnose reductase
VDGTTFIDEIHPLHFDVLDGPGKLREILRKRRYQFAINCIGVLSSAITDPDWRSVERAIRVNALFPHQLAATAMEYGCRVINISTDGVFSGSSTEDYTESSPVDCRDTYGRTKALGECAAENVINIRCSIIGRDWIGGKGIIEWFLRTPPGSAITGFCDYVWTGITTFQFAELCRRIIEAGAFERLRAESSVYHFAPNRAISKYELLVMLSEITGRHLQIQRGSSAGGPMRRVLANRSEAIPRLYKTRENWPDVLREALQEI